MALKPPSPVNQKLDALLGINPSESTDIETITPASIVTTGDPEKDFSHDHEVVRQSLHHLLEKGLASVDTIDALAIASQDSRMFEAAANTKKDVRETALALLGIHNLKGKASKPSTSVKGDVSVVNNLAFHGTTSDLLKQMKIMDNVETVIDLSDIDSATK